jgi:tyrosine-specific transport protein
MRVSPVLFSSLLIIICSALQQAAAFSPQPQQRIIISVDTNHNRHVRSHQSASTLLWMQPSTSSTGKGKERSTIDLAAFAESASFGEETSASSSSRSSRRQDAASSSIPDANFLEQFLLPVLSTALLITGNTVGASMLVLPELAAGPGMAISSGVLVGAYFMNLLSGLCIAQVAIRQHETSGDEVPSSFKEFAQANLVFDSAAAIVSGISIFVNSLVLAFDTTKAGQVLETMSGGIGGLDAHTMAYVWAAVMLGLVSTQSLTRLSQVASLLVVGLFVTFGGLLLPGLAQVADPLAVLTSGPAATAANADTVDLMGSVLHMAPVFVTTLVYQNIVPSATRILGYDRTKVVAAITLGSILPLFIYEAWCVAVLGGGISTTSSDLFTLFSIVTVAGSSMGALMSLSEEFEILLGQKTDSSSSSTTTTTKKDAFSFSSVALPSLVGLGVCHIFADDISGALHVAGSYGSPLLYGLIPVAMAYLQQQKRQPLLSPPSSSTTTTTTSSNNNSSITPTTVVPGGMAGLGVLGLGATALVGSELTTTVGQWLH